MPNLRPPVTTTELARAYRERILGALPEGSSFIPLMTLYLTDNTSPAEIAAAKRSGFVHAVKYYPAGATTHSDAGVTALERVYPALDGDAEPWRRVVGARRSHRRRRRHLRSRARLHRALAHDDRARFSRSQDRAGAHHHRGGRGVRRGGRPPASPRRSRPSISSIRGMRSLPAACALTSIACPSSSANGIGEALVAAATGGNPKFFLGTDSAPHATHTKENACGCAGCYSAPVALALYAEAFEAAGRARPARRFREPFRRRFLRAAAKRRQSDARARTVDRALRVSVRRTSGGAAAGRREGVLARALGDGLIVPCGRNLGAAMLSYASEASQTVAARVTGGGKSGLRRAGCRVTPGRNKSPLARLTKARNRATETSRRGSGYQAGGG